MIDTPDDNTKAKAARKPRSSSKLIMFLVVGFVVCVSIVLLVIPLRECRTCIGLGYYTSTEFDYVSEQVHDGFFKRPSTFPFGSHWNCPGCSTSGRMTIYRRWVTVSRESLPHPVLEKGGAAFLKNDRKKYREESTR